MIGASFLFSFSSMFSSADTALRLVLLRRPRLRRRETACREGRRNCRERRLELVRTGGRVDWGSWEGAMSSNDSPATTRSRSSTRRAATALTGGRQLGSGCVQEVTMSCRNAGWILNDP